MVKPEDSRKIKVIICLYRTVSSSCRLLHRQLAKCVINRTLPSVHSTRWLSSSNKYLSCQVENESGIATISMMRKPVNSLNLEFLTQLQITLEKLENERSCKALILTSGVPNIFSAGLDILEMYQPKPERLREFWRTLQEVWLQLYGSRLTTVAAINGHAPAGGCLLSIACDYRVMAAGPFTIGLNETQLGIVAPFWFKENMVNTIGHRETEYALQLGKLYSVEEALTKGLVDESVQLEHVVDRAQQELKKWLTIPEVARTLSKMAMRKETINKLLGNREDDINNFLQFITTDGVQKAIGFYLESLKKKSNK